MSRKISPMLFALLLGVLPVQKDKPSKAPAVRPNRKPDLGSPSGPCAWKRDMPEQDPQLAAWIVFAPDAHPAWSSYLISLAHLRPTDTAAAPERAFPTAAYELAVFVIDPQVSLDAPEDTLRILSGANVCLQFTARDMTDADAVAMVADAVGWIVKGALSPDSDHRAQWAHGIRWTLRRMGGGLLAAPGDTVEIVLAASQEEVEAAADLLARDADAVASSPGEGTRATVMEIASGGFVRATITGEAAAVDVAVLEYLERYPPEKWGTMRTPSERRLCARLTRRAVATL